MLLFAETVFLASLQKRSVLPQTVRSPEPMQKIRGSVAALDRAVTPTQKKEKNWFQNLKKVVENKTEFYF